jgi:phosphoglycerate dehydrogenase-like enzyme
MVTVLHHTNPDAMAPVRARFPEVTFVPIPTNEPLPDDVQGDILVTPPINSANLPEVMARGVRWVHVTGTGVDRFPLELIDDGRIITCARGASAVPIAEWTLAMMLAFEKRLPDAWITAPPEPPRRWHQYGCGTLHGATLGILGLGSIGVEVARRALAFGMRVKGVKRRGGPSPLPGVELVATAAEAVEGAHHVVVATPLTAETRHLVDASLLARVARGAHLVNIARGGVVDQDALLAALDDGTLAGASLDTVDPEPLPAGHWLYAHPKVRLSPHISWAAPGTMPLMYEIFADNLARYLTGEPLEGLVDHDARY